MPDNVAFISRKSDADHRWHDKVMSAARTDRQIDGFSALYSRCTECIMPFATISTANKASS